ncbi:hypothetical protein GWO43_05135 [candidate division KSB1 bacterium]|nr:hypothetical protein [candidate division KSB1 bacterium]NIR71468.1 hypothetical protein [candidate division KSB1 bacterium]NIS23389.1 hypothetical protein [candidate division KSB1 bacterium]NIT70280.1 hypothetical protein [candidate division KSB1 bacterium]NIU24003.1 hypothetical protein [candidate division KSB1 bacterium]
MKTRVILLASIFLCTDTLWSQPIDQHRLLIDMPTAGTLERGSFDIALRMFGNGGLLGGVGVGITPRFMIGLSFGGENIIGSGEIDWNPQPGIQGKVRFIDEAFVMPAITLGFNSQGYGAFNDAFDRYVNKSRGVYAVASKNYAFFENLGLHGGINYSLETDDNDEDLNVFLGADLSFNREFRFVFEYDLARNDNENDEQFGSGEGYLNLGVEWSFSDRLFLQFNLKDLLENGAGEVTREFRIGYFEYF